MVSHSGSSSPTSLSEPPDDFETSDHDLSHQPPSKRRRIGTHLRGSPATIDSPSSAAQHPGAALDDVSDVSSDSEGSVPGFSRLASIPGAVQDEDAVGAEQMRLCSWDGCSAGELANQDELVDHVHREHVNNAKKAKFACEWSDCKAKGKAQMSAYALRAHIRSHTKEKPFYCLLPECDKCFTRSDALAKHMRTVHENESLRTAEHYTKRAAQSSGAIDRPSSPQDQPGAAAKAPKTIKLHFNSNKSAESAALDARTAPYGGEGGTSIQMPLSPTLRDTIFGPFPEDIHFTQRESSLPRDELYGLLRRQIYWAEQDAVNMSRDIAAAEELRKHEWAAKEAVLGNLLEAEIAAAVEKGVFSETDAIRQGADEVQAPQDIVGISPDISHRILQEGRDLRQQPIKGNELPWYRHQGELKRSRSVHKLVPSKTSLKEDETGDYMSEA